MKSKKLKVLTIILGALLLVGGGSFYYVSYNPQIIIGAIQKFMYGDSEFNSYEPLQEPIETTKDSGIYYKGDLNYAKQYPNSYLDISYPDHDTTRVRPTIVYFHGGGFFGGSKVMGDPLASGDDSNYLLDSLVLEGYNLVNVDYALVPDYHFPVPVYQMNQAINYLIENSEELGLDMNNVVVMGSSAGAIMAAQYGAILSNPDYKERFDFEEEPKLTLNELKAIVVDDAPLNIPTFDSLSLKLMIANYLDDSIFFNDEEKATTYNPINYITSYYPNTFLTAGTDDGFPEDMKLMSNELSKANVENVYFYPNIDQYGETKHGYLANLKNDPFAAQDSYDTLIDFLRTNTSSDS